MPSSEKELLLRTLHDGREALGNSLAGLDETLAHHKPPAGGWSILECMEHMVQSERYLLTRLHAAKLSPEPFEKSRRAAKIAALAIDRTRPIQAPLGVHPHGRFASLAQALAAFDATRADVVRYVEQSANDLQCWITDHPLIPGPVTCYETLLMIAAHPTRHAQQILEIRAALAYREPTHERLP
ncbi:MAG: DinB family protein [Terracidiphilus sp.]